MPSLILKVSYGQIAVFWGELSQPFSNWTEQHAAQGFAWRPGTVSFRTLTEYGTHRVEASATRYLGPIGDDVIRAIEVPFEVPASGSIEVGSIADSVSILLPPGNCSLRCEFLGMLDAGEQYVHLVFAYDTIPHFLVVRADDQLSPGHELVTTAQPAK